MTKYCNNCNSQQESGAEHPNHNSSEDFTREERCRGCDRGTLSREMIENARPISDALDNGIAFMLFPLLIVNSISRFFTKN